MSYNSMSKQHFEAIAEAVATLEGANVRRKVAEKLVPVMQRFSSLFDTERFMIACCGEEPVPAEARPSSRLRPLTVTISNSGEDQEVGGGGDASSPEEITESIRATRERMEQNGVQEIPPIHQWQMPTWVSDIIDRTERR